MKKLSVFIVLFALVGVEKSFAQFNLSHLHSASGKHWVQKVNIDENRARPEDLDDSFTFYSDGKVTVDFGTTQVLKHTPDNTKPPKEINTWKVEGKIMTWSVLSGGQVLIYVAEIVYLDANKLSLSLLEPGKDERRNVLLIVK